MDSRITITFRVPIKVQREGEWIVSCCEIFDVASQGRTEEEARRNIVEALGLFFQTAYEMGTLEEIMKECGFSPDVSGAEEANPSLPGEEVLNVPLSFIISQKMHVDRCRA